LFCNAIPGQPCSFGCLVYHQIHDSIKATKLKVTSNLASSACEVKDLMAVCQSATAPKLSQRIDKNAIIAKYDEDCHKIGYSGQVTTVKKGEPTYLPTTYPTIFQLVRDCSMKPSTNHHYRVKNLVFENIVVVVLKSVNSFLSDVCIKKLKCLSHSFYEMVTDVCRLRTIDFSQLRKPRIGYSDQQEIQSSRVDLAAAGMIYYSLHPGMLIRFIKGEYIGENRNVPQVLNDVLPYINAVDAEHIERILSMGCLSIIHFEESSEMKATIIEKGNQVTFKMYPDIVKKTMNKEDRNSHLLPVKL
jgi:hypothetical protein